MRSFIAKWHEKKIKKEIISIFLAQNIVTHPKKYVLVCVRALDHVQKQKSIWSFYMKGISESECVCVRALIFSCHALYSLLFSWP